MPKQTMVFNTTCNRINWLAKSEHNLQYVRVGWKLTIQHTEYGVNRLYVDVLNITFVDNDNAENQITLDDYELLVNLNTDGITVFGLLVDSLEIKNKSIQINFK